MTLTVLELVGVFLVGMLVGALLWNRKMRGRSERPVARFISAVLEPVYYWFDLKGVDNRPSHSKVAYFLGLLTALGILIVFAVHEEKHGEAGSAQDVSLGFITFTCVVLAYALGKQVFNAFIATRLGDKLGDVMKARASGAQVAPPLPPGQGDRAGDRRADPPPGG